jgi:hypothetical protein
MLTKTRLAALLCAAFLFSLVTSRTEEISEPFQVYKDMLLAEIGPFVFERRAYILESIDELCRILRSFPDPEIVATLETETIGDSPVLDLIDRDGDSKADSYVYSAEGGGGSGSQHFGFIFDLNDDGIYDYVVFSQGIQFAKPLKMITTFYHMIDSNYDDRIDIYVRPDTDLNNDGAVEEGVFSWLYDEDFDGSIDSGEHLGLDVSAPMACDNDVIEMQCVMGGDVNVGDTEILAFATNMLSDINAALE